MPLPSLRRDEIPTTDPRWNEPDHHHERSLGFAQNKSMTLLNRRHLSKPNMHCRLQEFVTGQATQDDSIKSALNQTSKLQSEMAACMALASASAEQMKSLQGSLDKLDAAGKLCNDGLRNVPLDTSRLCVLVTLLSYSRFSYPLHVSFPVWG